MKKILSIICFAVILFNVSFLLANAEKKDSGVSGEPKYGHVSVLGYFHWKNEFEGSKDNTFGMERLYISWKKKIDDIFSMRVTLDAVPTTQKDVNGTVLDDGYRNIVKYAYFQIAPNLGPVKFTFQGGMIGTPVIGFLNKMSGIRWIKNTYIGASKDVLDGASIDTASDLGAKLIIDYKKLVSLTCAYTRGEGFKKAYEEYSGKSVHGLAVYNPFMKFYFYGYVRYYEKAESANMLYYGGGIAWKDKIIKTGIAYVRPELENKIGHMIDIWLNTNFNSLIGYPILLIGKYGYGNFDSVETNVITFGPGYRFNKNIQCTFLYQHILSESEDESNIYIKFEFKF